MAERTTAQQVRSLAHHVGQLARDAGVLTEEQSRSVVVQEGSATYGRAWRLYLVGNHAAMFPFPGSNGDGYLGMSKAEAWHTLSTMRNVLAAVLDARDAS